MAASSAPMTQLPCARTRCVFARASHVERARMTSATDFAIAPPIPPMLARATDAIPEGSFLYEPKWDGFRAIIFRGDADLYMQSRDLKPLDRYFPELHDSLFAALPPR